MRLLTKIQHAQSVILQQSIRNRHGPRVPDTGILYQSCNILHTKMKLDQTAVQKQDLSQSFRLLRADDVLPYMRGVTTTVQRSSTDIALLTSKACTSANMPSPLI